MCTSDTYAGELARLIMAEWARRLKLYGEPEPNQITRITAYAAVRSVLTQRPSLIEPSDDRSTQ